MIFRWPVTSALRSWLLPQVWKDTRVAECPCLSLTPLPLRIGDQGGMDFRGRNPLVSLVAHRIRLRAIVARRITMLAKSTANVTKHTLSAERHYRGLASRTNGRCCWRRFRCHISCRRRISRCQFVHRRRQTEESHDWWKFSICFSKFATVFYFKFVIMFY